MRHLLLAIVILLAIASCGTRQQRAERLIKKANSLYPIDSLVSEKITIDTLLQYDTTVVIKHDSVQVSIPSFDPLTHEKIIYNKKTIFDNARAKVTATTNSDGGIDLDILFKEQKIQVKGTIKYNKQIITHRKLITITVKQKGFFWWVGFGACFLLGGALIVVLFKFIKPKLL